MSSLKLSNSNVVLETFGVGSERSELRSMRSLSEDRVLFGDDAVRYILHFRRLGQESYQVFLSPLKI